MIGFFIKLIKAFQVLKEKNESLAKWKVVKRDKWRQSGMSEKEIKYLLEKHKNSFIRTFKRM